MSQRDQRRSLLSEREGFTRIPDAGLGQNGQDATVNIPLTPVATLKGYDEKGDEVTRGRRGGAVRKASGDNDDGDSPLTAMGRFYDKVYNFSILTRYILLLVPPGILIAVPIVIGATVAPNARIGPACTTAHCELYNPRIVWFFTWIEIVWLGLWGSKLWAKFLPKLFQVLAGAVSPGVRKYSLAIKRLELPLTLVFWFLICLATFRPVSFPALHSIIRQLISHTDYDKQP